MIKDICINCGNETFQVAKKVMKTNKVNQDTSSSIDLIRSVKI